ncbi:MAG: MFS transporter [Thermoplasmata archaeon]
MSGIVRSSRTELSAVLGATFLVRFAFGITTAVFATYLTGLAQGPAPVDYGTVGLVTAMASIAEAATVLGSGMLADRRGRWPVLAGGMVLSAAATAGFALDRSPLWLGALNFLFGIGSGAILTASLAVVADGTPTGRRGHEMGRFDAMNLAGWVVGFAVGYAALTFVAPGRLFAVFGIGTVGIVAGLAYARSGFRGRSTHAVGSGPLGLTALRRPEVLAVTLPWAVIYMLLGTALVFLAVSAQGVGIPPIDLAVGIGAGGLLLTVTQPAYGRLVDRFGTTALLLVGTGGFVLVLVGAALLASLPLGWPSVVVLAVGAVGALAYGPAAFAALADLSAQITRATTMAITTLFISLGMTAGLLGSTQLYARFGTAGIDLFFGILAAALALLAIVRVRQAPLGRPPVGPLPPTIPAR